MRRWLIAAAAVTAVVAVAGGAALMARDQDTGPGGLDRLRLRSAPGGAAGAQDLAFAPGAPGAAGWVAAAPLPRDRPAAQPVWRFASGQVPATELAAVAKALGLPADELAERDGGQVVEEGLRRLEVAATVRGTPWRFVDSARSQCPPPLPGGSPDQSVSCVLPSPGPDGRTPAGPRPPTAAQARKLAAPVLQAVGLTADQTRVTVIDSTAEVTVDPAVAGLPTVGWSTQVTVSSAGIVHAAGWLASPEQGRSYPVVSAQQAFERLQAAPVPLIGAEPAPAIAPADRGERPLPTRIVGAELGHKLDWEGTGSESTPLLVPAWLFKVEGQEAPVAVVAVEDDYLATPQPGD